MSFKEKLRKAWNAFTKKPEPEYKYVIPRLAAARGNGKMLMNSVYEAMSALTPEGKKEFEKKEKEIEEMKKNSEWVWVEGYKGTNADMTCDGYQYELGVQHDMPEDVEINVCDSGFHFCPELRDVFDYYKPMEGNRFFKVKALVRKYDLDTIKEIQSSPSLCFAYAFGGMSGDKLTSKSIVFIEEVSTEELYPLVRKKYDIPEGWSDEDVKWVIKTSINEVRNKFNRKMLIEDGYSDLVVKYIIMHCGQSTIDRAHALAHMEGVSADVKAMCIFAGMDDED